MSPERATEILESATGVPVLVVGDIMLDRYISGTVERVSPEAPVPVVRVENEASAVGGAANVAANVVALGASCSLVGGVGDDPAAANVLDALAARSVDTDGVVRTPGRPTTVKTRVMAAHQQIVRYDREVESEVGPSVATVLADHVRGLAAASRALVVQDYDKGTLAPPVIRSVLEAGDVHGLPTVVDPKRRSFFAYPGATVFKPNVRELEQAIGEPPRAEDSAWMEETRRRLLCRHLLVTRGARGMSLVSSDAGLQCLPAVGRGVYDVSGAGDTVTAVLAVALAAGAGVHEGAVLANHAAALEVAKPGVQTVSPEEIVSQIRARQQDSVEAHAD